MIILLKSALLSLIMMLTGCAMMLNSKDDSFVLVSVKKLNNDLSPAQSEANTSIPGQADNNAQKGKNPISAGLQGLDIAIPSVEDAKKEKVKEKSTRIPPNENLKIEAQKGENSERGAKPVQAVGLQESLKPGKAAKNKMLHFVKYSPVPLDTESVFGPAISTKPRKQLIQEQLRNYENKILALKLESDTTAAQYRNLTLSPDFEPIEFAPQMTQAPLNYLFSKPNTRREAIEQELQNMEEQIRKMRKELEQISDVQFSVS